jgi:hypothetical protein
MNVAARAERLFPHHDLRALERSESQAFVVARLLEEGDSRDLSLLIDQVREDELLDWLDERGGRQLSRRSLHFWRLVLGSQRQDVPAGDLWPL